MAKGGFRGGFGGSQANMMKQAQKMQAELAKAEEEVKSMEFEASAGGGMVKAVVSGELELKSLEIDPDACPCSHYSLGCSSWLLPRPRAKVCPQGHCPWPRA